MTGCSSQQPKVREDEDDNSTGRDKQGRGGGGKSGSDLTISFQVSICTSLPKHTHTHTRTHAHTHIHTCARAYMLRQMRQPMLLPLSTLQILAATQHEISRGCRDCPNRHQSKSCLALHRAWMSIRWPKLLSKKVIRIARCWPYIRKHVAAVLELSKPFDGCDTLICINALEMLPIILCIMSTDVQTHQSRPAPQIR